MEVKKCPYCGKTVLAISKVCKHCGKSFEQAPPTIEKTHIAKQKTEQALPPITAQNTVNQSPKDISAKKNNTGLIIGAVLLIVVLFAVMIVFLKKNNHNRSELERAKQELLQQENENRKLKLEHQRHLQQAKEERHLQQTLEIDMVFVEGGAFYMGCTAEQNNDCYDNEYPVVEKHVGSFYMGKYEVTQAQWRAVMGNNPSYFNGDNLPVENIYWEDVQQFISKLNEKTGKNYRLPTEAEWEFAARGGNKSRGYKYAGSNSPNEVAWFQKNSDKRTHPVGTKKPNELGIYDMSGNVLEWCADYWRDSYGDYAEKHSYRVNRGGKCISGQKGIRVADRGMRKNIEIYLGFRLARD
ncbi:MAG: SUMF1/EgtB/PvdO family nonheme iron enzyme [Dysgonamonadaceae bacterium]|jgi:formylglycine-generating enzyme required for sulfatase activity|nr:SUMF1/EgtB/PvdO family nonheme iron enzyme [Dysgonamonadaceae bacterium]